MSDQSDVQPAGAAQLESSNSSEMIYFKLYSKIVKITTMIFPRGLLSLLQLVLLIQAFALCVGVVVFHIQFITKVEDSCITKELVGKLREGNWTIDNLDVLKVSVSGIWSRLEEDNEKVSAEKVAASSDFFLANDVISVWLKDPMYIYTKERGFLMLDDATRRKHQVVEVEVKLETSRCFQSPFEKWERYLLDNFIGYDTIVLNSLGSVFNSRGILFSVHSRELFNLSVTLKKNAYMGVSVKLNSLFLTLFLFFISTTLVHYALDETNKRMLRFTVDLQKYVKRGAAYGGLILNHAIGSLVFIPIMVGMLFFMFEFFNDQLLSFMVLSIVWTCELYSAVALRTFFTIQNFPRLFFIYFASFHVYFFSYPSGFYYMALTSTVVFLQHAMLYLFVNYEIPAYESGRISSTHLRDVDDDDLIPEAVQAGGGSLSVRVLLGHLGKSERTATSKQAKEIVTNSTKANEKDANKLSPESNSDTNPSADVKEDGTEAFIARPAKKKRTTIHAENLLDGIPPVVASPSDASSTTKNGGGRGGGIVTNAGKTSPISKTWVDEDDSSSTGWEIGGGGVD